MKTVDVSPPGGMKRVNNGLVTPCIFYAGVENSAVSAGELLSLQSPGVFEGERL